MKRIFILSTMFMLSATAASGQAEEIKVITGATVIDATRRAPLKDAVIIIKGTRISQVGPRSGTKIPRGARLIDARGKYVIPGLADMHNHLGAGSFSPDEGPSDFKANLARMLGWGFTLIFDQGIPDLESFAELKRLAAPETAPYARFFGVGVRFAAPGGHGASLGAYTPESPDQARSQVRGLRKAGVDGVKIVYDDLSYVTSRQRPMLKAEVVAAIIDEAHKQGLKAYVHAPVLEYAKEVLRSGADGLVHAIISDPVDDEFISLLKKNRAVYITTHAIFESVADIGGWARREAAFDDRGFIPKEVFEVGMNPANVREWEARWDKLSYAKARLPIMRANLKKLNDSDIPVILGSDTSSAGSGTGVVLGLASQLELTLLVEAGLTPQEAIEAATLKAARMIGLEDELGSVEPGKLADLVILDADPLADIGNVRTIYRVIKGGVVHDPVKTLRVAN
jgi:imidazolonepropionase-like amidohydrolase